ncbi:mucin-2 [Streptomyces montanisoli]|uniref:Mucin-2 n=1 Tax=Streptomyces montanisoli TaxID=2798581 RepID=A0A940MBZ8_9ACTN|nr:mucin-2 [Streptomyces montanisoli]MBP0456226.1 mucin-2 [Streptomyces montanisoli]
MPWFKVDDTAHSHPKLIKAGNAAVGLWMRAGAYVAQHLTEGAVPGVVAQLYGTTPQARKLVTVGLWHAAGHTCPRCPQPATGDYQIHDYHQYNPRRAKVEDDRAAAAERQQRARERAAEQRAARKNASDSSTNRGRIDDESSTENLESAPNQGAFWEGAAGQEHRSQRDGYNPSRSPRPDPTPSTPYGSTTPQPPTDRPGTPGPAEQLLARWWETYGRTTAQSRTTVGRAIADALGNGLDPATLWPALDRLGDLSKPVTGGTLTFALAELKRPAPGAEVIPFDRAARPSTTDQRVAAGMDLAARLRAQEAAQ